MLTLFYEGKQGETFKGHLIVARTNAENTKVGTFSALDGHSRIMDCGSGVVCHNWLLFYLYVYLFDCLLAEALLSFKYYYLQCHLFKKSYRFPQNGIIQSDNNDKKEISVSWTAPQDFKGEIYFK